MVVGQTIKTINRSFKIRVVWFGVTVEDRWIIHAHLPLYLITTVEHQLEVFGIKDRETSTPVKIERLDLTVTVKPVY